MYPGVHSRFDQYCGSRLSTDAYSHMYYLAKGPRTLYGIVLPTLTLRVA